MAFFNRLWTHFSGDTKQLQKQTDAIKIGILGAANICNIALINPGSKLWNVFIYGVAARDRQKAETFARKHHIPKVKFLIIEKFSMDFYFRFMIIMINY
jgi:hypothetical protein